MAVYTEVSDEELAVFAAEYDFGEIISYQGIAEGVENTNYQLETETERFILTLYEKRVDPRDLPFFLGLMEHLAARGIPCPTPIHGRDGAVSRTLCNRPATIVTFLKGIWPRRVLPDHCAGIGKALANLHLAAEDFTMQRKNTLSVGAWRPLLEQCIDRADSIHNGLGKILDDEVSFLDQNWPKDIPAGICHADLFPDNVFFLQGKVSGLIDFYFACNEFLAYDLAICLNAWCFEGRAFNITKARRMFSAYRAVREFSQDELAALPTVMRGGAMRFLLTRLYDLLNHQGDSALVTPKDPLEYLAILRFHQDVTAVGQYGLD